MMKLSTIAERIGGELIGGDAEVHAIRSLETATPADITILLEKKFRPQAKQTQALAIVSTDIDAAPKRIILVKNPRKIFVRLLEIFNVGERQEGVHVSAIVASTATLNKAVWLDAFVTVGAESHLGVGCQIHAGVRIGRNVCVGDGTIIYPNVVIYDNTVIGKNCILHAGCVIGADGFGFEPDEAGRFQKVPQLARVVLGDNVEVGANACIDRGAIQDTIIGEGTKLDNLVQIGHNTRIGCHNVFSALCAIGGSTTIGDHTMWGGQAASAGHLVVGDHVTVMGKAGLTKDAQNGVTLQGFPARNSKETWKEQAYLHRWLKKAVQEKRSLTNE